MNEYVWLFIIWTPEKPFGWIDGESRVLMWIWNMSPTCMYIYIQTTSIHNTCITYIAVYLWDDMYIYIERERGFLKMGVLNQHEPTMVATGDHDFGEPPASDHRSKSVPATSWISGTSAQRGNASRCLAARVPKDVSTCSKKGAGNRTETLII